MNKCKGCLFFELEEGERTICFNPSVSETKESFFFDNKKAKECKGYEER